MAASMVKTTVLGACGGNAFFAVAQFGTAASTGSALMLVAAVQTTALVITLALLAVGLANSQPDADSGPPSSNGRELILWTCTAEMLVYSLAAGVALHAAIGELHARVEHAEPTAGFEVLGGHLLFLAALFGLLKGEHGNARVEGSCCSASTAQDAAYRHLRRLVLAAAVGTLVSVVGLALARLPEWGSASAAAAITVGLVHGSIAALAALDLRRNTIARPVSRDLVDGVGRIVREEMGEGNLILEVGPVSIMQTASCGLVASVMLTARHEAAAFSITSSIERIEVRVKQRFPEVTGLLVKFCSNRRDSAPRSPLTKDSSGAVETRTGLAIAPPVIVGAAPTLQRIGGAIELPKAEAN